MTNLLDYAHEVHRKQLAYAEHPKGRLSTGTLIIRALWILAALRAIVSAIESML